jgi:hypothetical protein
MLQLSAGEPTLMNHVAWCCRNHLLNIINDILDVAALKEGKLVIKHEVGEMCEVCQVRCVMCVRCEDMGQRCQMLSLRRVAKQSMSRHQALDIRHWTSGI